MNVQMNSDASGSQVIDPQHAADYIPSNIIKHQYFPYWLPVVIHNCCRWSYDTAHICIQA